MVMFPAEKYFAGANTAKVGRAHIDYDVRVLILRSTDSRIKVT